MLEKKTNNLSNQSGVDNTDSEGYGYKEIIKEFEGAGDLITDPEGLRTRIAQAVADLKNKGVDSNVVHLFENAKDQEMEKVLDEVAREYEVKASQDKPLTVGDMESIMSNHQTLYGDKKFTSSPDISSMPFMKPPGR
ncbi:MAG TPA: hypothetical protein QF353_06800 [Gammaproteobacteria bacterium]|nr:hypothetical protein [Gammaproteobacteria bacterium]